MVASKQVMNPFYRGKGQHRGWEIGVLAQVIGRTAIPFLRKYFVPPAERVSADLLEFAAPGFAEDVSGKKNFKTAARIAGSQTLENQLSSGSRKRTANRVFPLKSAN